MLTWTVVAEPVVVGECLAHRELDVFVVELGCRRCVLSGAQPLAGRVMPAKIAARENKFYIIINPVREAG